MLRFSSRRQAIRVLEGCLAFVRSYATEDGEFQVSVDFNEKTLTVFFAEKDHKLKIERGEPFKPLGPAAIR